MPGPLSDNLLTCARQFVHKPLTSKWYVVNHNPPFIAAQTLMLRASRWIA